MEPIQELRAYEKIKKISEAMRAAAYDEGFAIPAVMDNGGNGGASCGLIAIANLLHAAISLKGGREAALAKTKLEEAIMWAVKGVH